jgi:hypothetical protein
VEYVVADVGGKLAAPVYAMFQVEDLLKESGYVAPDGVALESYWLGPPPNDNSSSFEWAGEWTVTYETFRDMGAAFMVALVLIYILVVWEFGNFRIPLIIMAPIPLTLMGIIPAHLIMFHLGLGGEFTATSMIGWIALAGIIVRNSILLVDFSLHEVQRGIPVAEAVIRACKTRTRPIMITAFALVCGSSVIFTDPIFQGMAISLASGVMVSTILTLIVIPLGCINASESLCEVAAATAPPGQQIPCESEPQTVKSSTSSAHKTPLLLTIWSNLVGALIMVFYAIRGIFLLIMQMFKRKPKPKPPAPPPPPAAKPGPSSSDPGGSTPPASGSAPPSTDGGPNVEKGSDTAKGASAAAQSKQQDETQAPATEAVRVVEVDTREEAKTPLVKAKPIAEKQTDKKTEGGVEKKRASAPTKKKVNKKKVAKKKSSATKASQGSVTKTAAVQKKSSRRGIRLKVGDDATNSGLE